MRYLLALLLAGCSAWSAVTRPSAAIEGVIRTASTPWDRECAAACELCLGPQDARLYLYDPATKVCRCWVPPAGEHTAARECEVPLCRGVLGPDF